MLLFLLSNVLCIEIYIFCGYKVAENQKLPKSESIQAVMRKCFQYLTNTSSLSPSFLLEVPLRWAGRGDGVRGGRGSVQPRPLFPGPAGGPTLQVQSDH